jgi:toxin CptA
VYTLTREIEIKPSRWLGMLLLGMVGLALFAISLAALPDVAQLAGSACMIGLGVWGWRRALPQTSLRIVADGRLQCLDSAGEWRDAEVLGGSFVSTALIVLNYRVNGRMRTLTLFPDSADADSLRRIRVLLRWAGRTRSGTVSRDAD